MEKFLTVNDIQEILGLCRPSVYSLLDEDDFPVIRFGRAIRVPPDAFRRWVDAHTEGMSALPVRHAEWEWFEELNGNPLEGQDRDWGWRCSGCKTELPDDYDDPDCKPELKYCPECGAKMDGGEEHV